MEGRGSPSFVRFTLLINRQVVANGNRVPSPNLKCMHTAGSALYNMLLWSFFCNKAPTPSRCTKAHACIRG